MSTAKHQVIQIPPDQDFSPADVAAILHCHHADVSYWLRVGKLQGTTKFRGKMRITRTELIRFCQAYLRLSTEGE